MLKVQSKLRKLANKKRAANLSRFFKTGPGMYGEGDIFLGCTNSSELRVIAKENTNLSYKEISTLLKSPYHEERMLAVDILVLKYRDKKINKKELINFYLNHRNGLNNWDLVDASAYKILGDYYQKENSLSEIQSLSKSSHHWDKRIAMVSSLAFIRSGNLDLTYELAERFLVETEDLMHKATGWMLREAGKRDTKRLLLFIKTFGPQMPRTMLRYAIEKFSPSLRKKILKSTK